MKSKLFVIDTSNLKEPITEDTLQLFSCGCVHNDYGVVSQCKEHAEQSKDQSGSPPDPSIFVTYKSPTKSIADSKGEKNA